MKRYFAMTDLLYRVIIFLVVPAIYVVIVEVHTPMKFLAGMWASVIALEIMSELHFFSGIYGKEGARALVFMTASRGGRFLITVQRFGSARIYVYNFFMFCLYTFRMLKPFSVKTDPYIAQRNIWFLFQVMLLIDLLTMTGLLIARFFGSLLTDYILVMLIYPMIVGVQNSPLFDLAYGYPQTAVILLILNGGVIYLHDFFLKRSLRRRFCDE